MRYEKSLRTYALLLSAYQELSNSLRKDLGNYEEYIGTRVLFIPPILSIILSRSSRPSDIPEVFLELREQFKDLREYLRVYQHNLRDRKQPIGKSLKAVDELEKSLKKLSKRHKETGTLLISEWHDALSLLPDASSLEDIDTSITKLILKKPIEWAVHKIRNRKLMPLFNLRRDFYKIKDYTHLIQKVFAVNIDPKSSTDYYGVGTAFNRMESH